MTAAERARVDIDRWIGVAQRSALLATLQPGASERDVTGFDPEADLRRRAGRWSHDLVDSGLGEVSRFAAGLAAVEADAWEGDDPVVATAAFEDRRFLFSDRVVHWAVPWADVAGRCHPEMREVAHELRDTLLVMGDELRPAPLLTGDEGLHPPGEDSFGPIPGDRSLRVLGCGTVLFEATVTSLGARGEPAWAVLENPTPSLRRDLATHFEAVAARWRTMSDEHPGTARLWRDLARRAERTRAWIVDG